MIPLLHRGWGFRAPPASSRIDTGHPLGRHIVFAALLESAGGGRDLVTGKGGVLGTNTTIQEQEVGRVLSYAASALGSTFTTSELWHIGRVPPIRGASMMAWINATWGGAPGYNPCWLSNRDGTTRWSAHIGNGNGETNKLGLFNGTSYVVITPSFSFSKNAWHLIALTFDPSDTMRAYLDGVLVGSASHSTGSADGLPMTVGAATPGGTDPWQGYITWPVVASHPFNADEIRWLYEEPYAFIARPGVSRYFSIGTAPPAGAQRGSSFYDALRPLLTKIGAPSYG